MSGTAAALVVGGFLAGLVQPEQLLSAALAQEPVQPSGPVTQGAPPGGAFLIDLRQGLDNTTEYLSDFDVNEEWIHMAFRDENIVFGGDGMQLQADKPDDEAGGPYTSSEFQRRGFYGYGRYEVVMRSSGAYGVVSSFFTHTDGQFGDPHSEIDFEFIGRSPQQVHLNYYTAGKDDPVNVELGFDASKGQHLYAFEWMPDSIRWYVDGLKVREVVAATSPVGIPSNSSRVMANTWTGNRTTESWVGTPEFETTSALYTCISHVPAGQHGKQCSDTFVPPPR